MADRFLTDIAMPRSPAGELRATPTGDLKLSAGRDNAAQALERRVLVGQGTLLHRSDYGAGLKMAIERSTSPTERAQQAARIQRQMARDERVVASESTVSLSTDADSRVVVDLSVQLKGDDDTQTLSIDISE